MDHITKFGDYLSFLTNHDSFLKNTIGLKQIFESKTKNMNKPEQGFKNWIIPTGLSAYTVAVY